VLQKPHSQEWLCYENRSLTDFFRSLFSLPDLIFATLEKVKSRQAEACPTLRQQDFLSKRSRLVLYLLAASYPK
jgi:hypothetical protein